MRRRFIFLRSLDGAMPTTWWHLFLHQQGLNTSTTAGKAMVFAEFERGIIKERVNAGLARARSNGTKLGRGNRKDGKASADENRSICTSASRQLHKGGMGILKIGREVGGGTSVVQRVLS